MEPPLWAADASWQTLRQELAQFPIGFTLLELCAGAGTASLAAKLLLGQGRLHLAGAWDVDPALITMHHAVHGGPQAGLFLGPQGDILRCPCADFPSAHMVIAGPPCPPFSSLGSRLGLEDIRSRVFSKAISIIVELSRRPQEGGRPPLVCFIIEHVKGIARRPGRTGASALDIYMTRLRKELGAQWDITALHLNTLDYGLPHRRHRVYIVGRRVSYFGAQPLAPPPQFAATVAPRDLLGPGVPPLQAPSTYLQSLNLQVWKTQHSIGMRDGTRRGQVAFIDASRDPTARTSWTGNRFLLNVCECLTARGPKLHVFALGEGVGALSLDRLVLPHEHGALQGFPELLARALSDPYDARRVFGNAMSVPVIGSLLGVLLRDWWGGRNLVTVARALPADAEEREVRLGPPLFAQLGPQSGAGLGDQNDIATGSGWLPESHSQRHSDAATGSDEDIVSDEVLRASLTKRENVSRAGQSSGSQSEARAGASSRRVVSDSAIGEPSVKRARSLVLERVSEGGSATPF